MKQKNINKLVIIALLVTTGILLEVFGVFDAEKVLHFVRGYADRWWLVLIFILAQIILFTFALAGSFALYVVAPLYPPLMSCFILTVGGVIGGITAYLFSKRLTDEWVARVESSRVYKFLHKQDNFFTLFAMRIFPGFPHSLINYSSGILNVKLSHFILAAVIGLGIKTYLYSSLIYSFTSMVSLKEMLDITVYGPLVMLSALSLIGVYINHRLSARQKDL